MILHSHYYRRPSDFTGKTVLIQGAGPSAIDIVLELSKTCTTVWFSHHGQMDSTIPLNIIEQPDISHVNENGDFVFENNEIAKVDVFIPCTGYSYDFPFLDSDSKISIQEDFRVVRGLYLHIFNIVYPSLSFIGIPWKNAPLPMFHQQCSYVCNILNELKQLPTEEDMLIDTETERRDRLSDSEPLRYFHRMGPKQFAYNNRLAELSGCAKNPPIYEDLYRYAQALRKVSVMNYKDQEFVLLNDSKFRHVKN